MQMVCVTTERTAIFTPACCFPRGSHGSAGSCAAPFGLAFSTGFTAVLYSLLTGLQAHDSSIYLPTAAKSHAHTDSESGNRVLLFDAHVP
jgi:hypothetical protein